MARFTSIHPLHFTDPAVRFQPEGSEYALETDDDTVIDAMRALPASFGVVEHVIDELDSKKKPELEAYATEYGIDLTGCRSNADRIKAIRAHFAALADHSDDPADPDETTPAVLESAPVPAVDDDGDED